MTTINPLIPKNARQLFIDGPVGMLDCLELSPADEVLGVAIVAHPDPKGGGTNTNKIVQTTAKTLTQKGYLCYCPNLRGVGLSDGIHDMGIGEVADAKAIHDFIRKQYPNLPLILAGFSFGTSVVSNLAKNVDYKQLILIGPAVSRYPVIVTDVTKTIVIHGEEDEVISLSEVFEWGRKNNQPIIWYPSTGHCFHGKIVGLANLLVQLIL